MTSEGLVELDPHSLPLKRSAPPAEILAINVNGRSMPFRDHASLPPGTRSVGLEYNAIDLTNPQLLRFRYRLEGVDADWVQAGKQRQANYSNLGPGDYRFVVQTTEQPGVWGGSPTAITFTIRPTFVQTLPFKLLCLFGLLLGMWAVYRIRVRHIAARIRGEAAMKARERDALSRDLHDTLLQGMQALMVRFHALSDRLAADHPVRRELFKALDLAEEALIDGRKQIIGLRKPRGSDLESVLRRSVQEAQSLTEAPIRFQVQGDPYSLAADVVEQCERVASEAMFNAARHSEASQIDVTLEFGPDALRLTVHDDGRGIPPEILHAEGARTIWASPACGNVRSRSAAG
ncbi:triple tyrosine motif-containing protein [uncultured Sphingomonas sp.]|uniref:ATP-binding protein n=1 Tax=uncultured Sphingomonas sp. TaxID=158754 RepID=UPI003749F32A